MKTPEEILKKYFECNADDALQLCITLNPSKDRIISAMKEYASELSAQHEAEMERFVKWYEDNYFSTQSDGRNMSVFYTDDNGKSHKSYTFSELLSEFRKQDKLIIKSNP